MPEDQGVNGDRWTEQASLLFRKFGWNKVADSNIDIPGVDGLMHGIDSIFKYYDGARLITEGVFLEAKDYETSSFRLAKLKDWVARLDEKIYSLSRSEEFLRDYPAMTDAKARNGLLVIWFRDTNNFPPLKEKIIEEMEKIKVPQSRNPNKENRLFVLMNDDLLRLASLVKVLDGWTINSNDQNGNNPNIHFVYPSVFKNPVQELLSLNIEYLFSKIIFARGKEKDGNGIYKDADILFYFGKHDIDSYVRLRDGMLLYNFLNQNNKLYIYQYVKDINFRKIEADVRALFEERGYPKVEFRQMDLFSEIPEMKF